MGRYHKLIPTRAELQPYVRLSLRQMTTPVSHPRQTPGNSGFASGLVTMLPSAAQPLVEARPQA